MDKILYIFICCQLRINTHKKKIQKMMRELYIDDYIIVLGTNENTYFDE